VRPGENPAARIDLRYEFVNDDALIASMLLSNDGQRYAVEFLNFSPLPAGLIQANQFPGPAKPILHYVYLLIAFAVMAFILATLYFCIRGPAPRWRWRWLWLIAIILTVVRFNLAWSTGELIIAPIGLVPFGFWFIKNGVYASYIFTIGFPLGAILFWVFRPRWIRKQKAALAAKAQAMAQDAVPTASV
jgi:hypothetical protein